MNNQRVYAGLQKVLFPPVWVILVLSILSAVSLVLIFAGGYSSHPTAPFVYTLSFYTLSVISLACWKRFPLYAKTVREKIHTNPYTRRYVTDAVFKTQVHLYVSITADVLYAAVIIIFYLFFHTRLFGIFAGYYLLLAGMRFLLVCYIRRNRIGENRAKELKRARLCSCILLSVNVALSVLVFMTLHNPERFGSMGILIYVAALYTFTIVSTAVSGIIRFRKYQSPVLSTAKLISLTAALVSLLYLEIMMLAEFGGAPAAYRDLMIILTGACISGIIILSAVSMICRTTKELRRVQH